MAMTSIGEDDLVGMARVLLDTNVIIDLMGRGLPHQQWIDAVRLDVSGVA